MSFDLYNYSGAYITFAVARENCDIPGDRDPVVHARTALLGLMYWNDLHTLHQPLPELPEFLMGKLIAFDTGRKCISADDSEILLTVAVSVCERNWNKTPELTGEDEEKALSFLKWLRVNGDITNFKIRGEEYEG
jgi:hypothetical protein